MSNKAELQDRIDNLIDELVSIRNGISDIPVQVIGVPEEEVQEDLTIQPEGVTLKEISLNVSGLPDLHITNAEQFGLMREYYDPEKEPFTTYTWQTMLMIGKDSRPYKPRLLDGVMVRKTNGKQAGAFLGYWIAKGYMRVEEDVWYKRVDAEDGVTSNEQELWLATYPNRSLDTSRWYRSYRKMYEAGDK